MSKHQIVRELHREIARLNRIIDLAIIRGLPYREEARRHKFLTAQLRRLQPRRSVFSMLSFSHMFML